MHFEEAVTFLEVFKESLFNVPLMHADSRLQRDWRVAQCTLDLGTLKDASGMRLLRLGLICNG